MASGNYSLIGPTDIKSSSVTGRINVFSTNSANAVNIQAPSSLTSNIDFTLPSTAGTTGQFLQRTGANSSAWNTASGNLSGVGLPLYINFQTGAPPTTGFSVPSGQSLAVSYFIFPGTNVMTPTVCQAVVSGGNGYSIRIVDYTNGGNQICILFASFGVTTLTISNFGPLTNLPATQAIFQVNVGDIGTVAGGSIFSITFR